MEVAEDRDKSRRNFLLWEGDVDVEVRQRRAGWSFPSRELFEVAQAPPWHQMVVLRDVVKKLRGRTARQ